jgi:zinc D-Ala-D-Ala carboxypeptidase
MTAPLSPADASLEIERSLQGRQRPPNESRGEARIRISLVLALALFASELLPAWLTRSSLAYLRRLQRTGGLSADACPMHTEYAYCVSMENVRRHCRQGRALARGVAACVVVAAVGSAGYAAYGAGIRPLGGASGSVTTAPPPTGVAPTGNGDVRHLDPALRHAFAVARRDAAAQGIEMSITSGWRSHAEQATLFAAAVRKYGSAAEASHWVLPPGQSAHERGAAIDVGPAEGAAWLDAHGVHYGLCRRYQNEPWHFELLAPALGQACPPLEPYAHAAA